jgi:hypothetical protein
MCRKLFTGIALLGLGSYLWMGTSVGSYVRTGYAQMKGFVQGQVPVEFEIERAKNMLNYLRPETESARRSILKEEVKVDRLKRDLVAAEKNLESEKVAILSLRQQLSKGLTSHPIGGQTYSAAAVEKELNRRFNSYKRVEEVLGAKKDVLASREQALLSAKEKHDRLLESQQELESRLEALVARHKMIEVKKVSSNVIIDDSQVSQLKQLMEDIHDSSRSRLRRRFRPATWARRSTATSARACRPKRLPSNREASGTESSASWAFFRGSGRRLPSPSAFRRAPQGLRWRQGAKGRNHGFCEV